MVITNERIKQILDGAPANDWTHYCTRNRQYFKRDGNTDRLFVWISNTEVWSVPLVDKPRWLERRERLEEILALRQRVQELEAQAPKWISVEDRLPDVLEVRVKLLDGSEVNCWAQSDGDFYWKCGGSEVFISEHQVTHWMPQPPKEQDDE